MTAPRTGSLPHTIFLGLTWRDSRPSEHLRSLADELVRRGHRVVLLVDRRRTDLARPEGNPAIRVWPSVRPTGWRDALFLRRLARRLRPTAVVANQAPTNLMLLVGLLARVPVRLAWHRTLSDAIAVAPGVRARFRAGALRRRKGLVLRAATGLLANSEASARDLERVFGVPREKIEVVPNSFPDPFPEGPPSAAGRALEIVCPGRFHPTKGQDVLIEAVARLETAGRTVRVTFLGDGETFDACRSLAAARGVADRLVFVGAVGRREVVERLARAAVAAVPSRSEAFGFVNIEAMAAATPVVASEVGGIPEIVRDGREGLLVPPEDPDALAAALARLLDDPELRRQLGNAGRARFLERFEEKRALFREADLLEAACRTARPSGGSER